MALGLIGKKIGMTRVFTEEGRSWPVTVVEATPNRVTQVKTGPADGYDGVQVTIGRRRPGRVGKAMQGHFAKAGVEPGRGVWEFRLAQSAETEPAAELTVEMFSRGQKVDVAGRTIGKGFAGVIKRHGMRGGRASHGNSKAHRLGGSIGNAQDPGRVFKGKKMAGHMGSVRRVQQGLEVIRVDPERNLLLIGGSIPGARGSDVIVRPSVKAKNSSGAPAVKESQPGNQPANKPEGKPESKANDQTESKQENKRESKSADRPVDKSKDKPTDKTKSKSADKPENKPADKPESKSADKSESKSADKSVDKSKDTPTNKPKDKPANQSTGQSTGKPAGTK